MTSTFAGLYSSGKTDAQMYPDVAVFAIAESSGTDGIAPTTLIDNFVLNSPEYLASFCSTFMGSFNLFSKLTAGKAQSLPTGTYFARVLKRIVDVSVPTNVQGGATIGIAAWELANDDFVYFHVGELPAWTVANDSLKSLAHDEVWLSRRQEFDRVSTKLNSWFEIGVEGKNATFTTKLRSNENGINFYWSNQDQFPLPDDTLDISQLFGMLDALMKTKDHRPSETPETPETPETTAPPPEGSSSTAEHAAAGFLQVDQDGPTGQMNEAQKAEVARERQKREMANPVIGGRPQLPNSIPAAADISISFDIVRDNSNKVIGFDSSFTLGGLEGSRFVGLQPMGMPGTDINGLNSRDFCQNLPEALIFSKDWDPKPMEVLIASKGFTKTIRRAVAGEIYATRVENCSTDCLVDPLKQIKGYADAQTRIYEPFWEAWTAFDDAVTKAVNDKLYSMFQEAKSSGPVDTLTQRMRASAEEINSKFRKPVGDDMTIFYIKRPNAFNIKAHRIKPHQG